MNQLKAYDQGKSSWPLEEFVRIANSHLPQFLPQEKTNTRVREAITPRLVRHYTTINILDEPLKIGREARYTYRHLLQVLVLRRVLAEGHSAGAIDQLLLSSSNVELEILLEGGIHLAAFPGSVPLSPLQGLQQRQSITLESTTLIATDVVQQTNTQNTLHRWIHLNVLPGLELHIQDDFRYPTQLSDQTALLEAIVVHLQTFGKSNEPS